MFAPIFASNLVGEMANGHHRTASPSHARADRQCSPVSEVGDESEGSNVSSTPAEISPRDELAEDEVDIESESLVPKKKTASNLRTAKKLDITVTASRKVAECDDIWGALKSFIGNVAGIDGDIGEGFPYLHALIAMSKDLLRGRSGLIPKLMTVSILLRCLWDGAITSARDLDGGVSNLDHERRISLSSDTGCLIRSFYAGKDNTWEPPASLPPPSRLGSP